MIGFYISFLIILQEKDKTHYGKSDRILAKIRTIHYVY